MQWRLIISVTRSDHGWEMETLEMNSQPMIRRRCVAPAPHLRSRRALPGAASICLSLLLVLVSSAIQAATEEGDAHVYNHHVHGKASLSARPAGEGTALQVSCSCLIHFAGERSSSPGTSRRNATSQFGLLDRWTLGQVGGNLAVSLGGVSGHDCHGEHEIPWRVVNPVFRRLLGP